ncbi:hypothetical protein R3P38DRAFT_2557709 [Favolaschia claudopus]|uniref:MYND-type domain-containing protein n=1 Tax=Favolaschia claudopus TaxID=2862362 RepID=A0AAW0A6Z4_9AGAR
MHPSLKLSALSSLPFSLRRRARLAASGSSPRETVELVNELHEIPTETIPGFLPVFYALLDLSQIPDILDRLQNSEVTNLSKKQDLRVQVVQVFFCLRGICLLDGRNAVLKEALPEIWERALPWIPFLPDTPWMDIMGPQLQYSLFVTLIRLCRENKAVDEQIDGMPSLVAIIGRAWRYLLDKAEDNEEELRDVCHFFGLWFRHKTWNSEAFNELVLGAGGTRADVASLIIKHFNHLIPTTDTQLTNRMVLQLVGIVYFIGCTSASIRGLYDYAFRDALLSEGLIPVLTRVAIVLNRSQEDVVNIQLQGVFGAIVDHVSTFPRQRWILSALSVDFFRVVFACAAPRLKDFTYQHVEFLLREVLPGVTVYHSVLCQLRVCLEEFDTSAVFTAEGNEGFLKLWQSFLALVESRLKILDEYPGIASNVTRACDNLECTRLSRKRTLRRCSACENAYYCSESCQLADWINSHRDGCAYLSARRSRQTHLTTRDRSFLRALVHHDSVIHQDQITREIAALEEQNPEASPNLC